MQNNKRYKHWHAFSNNTEKEKVVGLAVKKLKEMDEILKSKGFSHLIFISPSKPQVFSKSSRDEFVFRKLKEEKLDIHYISDDLAKLDSRTKEKIFYDDIHLTSEGHNIYASIIRDRLIKSF